MATLNLSLPDAMKAWIEAQTKGGQYNNASEYVRDLIRRDQNNARSWNVCKLLSTRAAGAESAIARPRKY